MIKWFRKRKAERLAAKELLGNALRVYGASEYRVNATLKSARAQRCISELRGMKPGSKTNASATLCVVSSLLLTKKEIKTFSKREDFRARTDSWIANGDQCDYLVKRKQGYLDQTKSV